MLLQLSCGEYKKEMNKGRRKKVEECMEHDKPVERFWGKSPSS